MGTLKVLKETAKTQILARVEKANSLTTAVERAQNFHSAYPSFVRELQNWRRFNETLLKTVYDDRAIVTAYSNLSSGGFLLFTGDEVQEYEGYKSELMTEISFLMGCIDELSLHEEPQMQGDVFKAGQTFDAFIALNKIITQAQAEIFIVDGYVTEETLNILSAKNAGVTLRILTNLNNIKKPPLFTQACKAFVLQYGGLEVKLNTNIHDRFIVIDNAVIYQPGGSLKDLGKKTATLHHFTDAALLQKTLSALNSEWSSATSHPI